MEIDIPGKSKNAGHDQTDIELAVDADLNKNWKNDTDKTPPSASITLGEAVHINNKSLLTDDNEEQSAN